MAKIFPLFRAYSVWQAPCVGCMSKIFAFFELIHVVGCMAEMFALFRDYSVWKAPCVGCMAKIFAFFSSLFGMAGTVCRLYG